MPFKKGQSGNPAGRKPGSANPITALVKDAMGAVYGELQAETDPAEQHAHFKKWAKDNATEFYKLWAKMLPVQVSGDPENPIHTIVEQRIIDPSSDR